jgi:hypothetical protein
MPLPASRSVVLISGLLTLLVLGGGTLAVAFHTGWLRTASADVPSREAVTASAQSTPTPNGQAAAARLTEPSLPPSTQGATQDEIGVYRQKLEEAYRALDDAYAQIRVLQSPQPQLASVRNDDDRFTNHDGDDDRRGRRSDRGRSHDD